MLTVFDDDMLTVFGAHDARRIDEDLQLNFFVFYVRY